MTTHLKSWGEYLDALKPAGDLAARTWRPDDDQYRADLYNQLMMNISYAYFVYFQSTETNPDFMPLFNSVYMLQPNPDDVYYWAPLQGDLRYRIVGNRGSIRIVSFLHGQHMIGMSDTPQPGGDYYEIDDLEVGEDGSFELIMSAERPGGYTGNWRKLDPQTDHIIVRLRSYDWGNETDCRLAIECLDGPESKHRFTVEETAERLEKLVRLPERWSAFWIDWQNTLRDRLEPNTFEHNATFESMSAVPRQVYWQAIYEFSEGEALILETELPEVRPYWNVQMNDGLFNALDFITRQSSLNGHQAMVDSDGKFRAVIANEDPGVPNWLDAGGLWLGTVIGRWLGCDSAPVPADLKRVKLSDVRRHLPADTPTVSPEERRETLRDRAIGAKLRRRW